MKERPKHLPIFDANNGSYPAIRPYPIQPYRMGISDCISLPSFPYKNIVSCYHQKRTEDGLIYPSLGCAIVCTTGTREASSVLVGPPTFPRKPEYLCPKIICFVAIFWPDAGYGLFSGFINEAIDNHIPLYNIFPDFASWLTEEMASAETFLQRICIFENFLNRILTNYAPIPIQHRRLLNKIIDFHDSSLANGTWKLLSPEFSSRHVRRLCTKYLGITPKLFARINRYQNTLRIMNMNPYINLSRLAVEMGYFDQSHFIKEFKRFQNETPLEFFSKFAHLEHGKYQETFCP